jgi:hypothetical protein
MLELGRQELDDRRAFGNPRSPIARCAALGRKPVCCFQFREEFIKNSAKYSSLWLRVWIAKLVAGGLPPFALQARSGMVGDPNASSRVPYRHNQNTACRFHRLASAHIERRRLPAALQGVRCQGNLPRSSPTTMPTSYSQPCWNGTSAGSGEAASHRDRLACEVEIAQRPANRERR